MFSVFIVNIILFTIGTAEKYTVCTGPQNLNACEQLNRTEDLKCVVRKNAVDCLLMVENGRASLTSVTPEEAFLAAPLTNNLFVLAEFIERVDGERLEYETAILVRKEISSGMKSLNGTKYCHPGFDIMDVSPLILKEFEMKVLEYNNVYACSDDDKTITEKYINTLNYYFGPSCRPGKWSVSDNMLDSELKQKYTKLTELCGTAAYQENQNQPFAQSLNCLLDGHGDLALTTINTIKENTKNYPNLLSSYTLLCKNGSHVNVTVGCSWTRQPVHLLVGNKQSVSELPQELKIWFGSSLYNISSITEESTEDVNLLNLTVKFTQILKELIFPKQSIVINVMEYPPNLEDYIKERRDIPTPGETKLSKSTVNWCVTPNEEKKCKWLQQAALNYGLQPVIHCVAKADKAKCVSELQRTVDLVVTSSKLMYPVKRKNLTAIAFGEEESKYMSKAVLVVKSTAIKSLRDLENKMGCFAEYGDVAWLAFTDLISKIVWNGSNNYGEDLSKFLGESCMPGIQDMQEHEPYQVGINFDKLCDICESSIFSPTKRTCKPDNSNEFYGNDGALKCLTLRGDFAVVTITESILRNFSLTDDMQVMCRNGSLATTNTLDVDYDCALAVTMNDVLVTRTSDPRNKDIELLLLNIDQIFASQSHTPFKIFDRFEDDDLIFKSTTIGLDVVSASNNKHTKTQWELFNNIPEYKVLEFYERDSVGIITTNILLLVILISITITFM